jgi:hypothetical protein
MNSKVGKVFGVVLAAIGIYVMFCAAGALGMMVRDIALAVRLGGRAAAAVLPWIMFDVLFALILGGLAWLMMTRLPRAVSVAITGVFAAMWLVSGLAQGFG